MKTFSLCLFLLTLSLTVFSQQPCSQDTAEMNTLLFSSGAPSGSGVLFSSADTINGNLDSIIDVQVEITSGAGDALISDVNGIVFNSGVDSGIVACATFSFYETGTVNPVSLSTFFTINIPSGGGVQILGSEISSYSVLASTSLDHLNFDGTTATIINESGSAENLVLYTEEASSVEVCYINGSSTEPSTYALNSSTIPQGDSECFTPDGSPLAINFLEFVAAATDENKVDLSWTAVDEGQGVYDIEFSSNGYDFSVLDQVEAAKNNSRSSASSYRTTVAWPDGAVSGYFRLKHVDLDGEITYTQSIELSQSSALSDIKAYPVPTHGVLNIQSDKAAKLQEPIKIYDLLGSLVYEEENNSNTAVNTSIDISSLISGVYILKIGAYTQRIQKL